MKIILHILAILFIFQGCLYTNNRGISTDYYSDCKEYYDSEGFYRKTCDENLVDFKDIGKNLKEMKEYIAPEHGAREFKFGF